MSTKPMTADELDAIRRMLKHTTPGPWRLDDKKFYVHKYQFDIDAVLKEMRQNAEFIANATDVISLLLAEVERLNKVSRYLAEQMVHDGGAGLRWAGAFDEDFMRMYKTKEEAIQSWLDEANRKVSDAE